MVKYINLEEVINKYSEEMNANYLDDYAKGFQAALLAILNVPPADVEPVRHEHWEQVDDSKCKCSECETITMIAQYPIGADKNYCPNCGAKMDGKDGE